MISKQVLWLRSHLTRHFSSSYKTFVLSEGFKAFNKTNSHHQYHWIEDEHSLKSNLGTKCELQNKEVAELDFISQANLFTILCPKSLQACKIYLRLCCQKLPNISENCCLSVSQAPPTDCQSARVPSCLTQLKIKTKFLWP